MFRTCPNKLNCLKERRKTLKKNVISCAGRIKFQLLNRNYHYYSRPQNNLQPSKALFSPKEKLFWGFT